MWYNDYVVFDTETTGLKAERDEIIEISALKIRDNKVVGEFSKLICPTVHIPAEVTAVNNITDDMVKGMPSAEEVMPQFLDFIGSDVLLGYNVIFDINFVNETLRRNFFPTLTNEFFDVMSLPKKALRLPRYKQTTVCDALNIPTEGAHRALADCEMCNAIYQHFKGLSKPLGGFKFYVEPKNDIITLIRKLGGTIVPLEDCNVVIAAGYNVPKDVAQKVKKDKITLMTEGKLRDIIREKYEWLT